MGLASIERLPVELLQPIFIESGHNLALLQSSPYIAARLSSEYIYNSTCNYYLTGVHGERTRQSSAQTFIFASKCMTWAFLKSWCLRRFGSKGCFCDRKPEEGCFDAQWPPNFDNATKMVFSRSHLPRLAFVKGRIPRKLLRGPWSSSKIEFLRFLLWMTSMSVDWHDPDTAQAAIQGRKEAILEQNLEAVELFNHNRRLGRPANLETVAFAVMEADCNRSVVYDTLLVANMWSNNQSTRYSNALHEWCDGQIATGNPKGTWLLKKLEESLILRARDGLKRGDCQEKMHARHVALEMTSETYDGGFEDLLTVNELEWNKVNSHRGWLISRSTGYSCQTINHNISWPEVTRSPGYRMYRGPSSPRRLKCWVEHDGASRTIDLWLSPPASRFSTRSILERRTSAKVVL